MGKKNTPAHPSGKYNMASKSHKDCIAKDTKTCAFAVAPNNKADGKKPIYEISSFSEVNRHLATISKVAKDKGIDSDLMCAIMYMETTHGYYDAPLSIFGQNKSILPMNINVDYWGDAFGTRKELEMPDKNIRAGAEILKRIIARLPKGSSVEQIATLYNNINASTVSDYGARVRIIYYTKPWVESKPKEDNEPLFERGSTIRPMPLKYK